MEYLNACFEEDRSHTLLMDALASEKTDGIGHGERRLVEKLMKDKKQLRARQEAMGRHARKLVYGLDKDMYAEGDAFDQLWGRLRHYVDGYWPDRIRCPVRKNILRVL